MALARIITRSHACSRELALDLLARGYAVEIVSPDKIPDNIADLELRVDAGPGDRLIASVETHDGERSASLDFVHHLKAPMGNFIRRPGEPGEAVLFPDEPVSFNAEQSVEDMELPAEAPQLAPKAVSPAAGIPFESEHDPGFDFEEGARLIVPPEPSPPPRVEPPGYFAVDDSAVARPAIAQPTIVQPAIARPRPSGRDRSAGWRWRATLTFASVILLAVLLGFGMRRTGKAATQSSAALPAEKLAATSADGNLSIAADSEKEPGQVPAPAMSPAAKSGGNPDHAPKELPVAKAETAPVNPRPRISRRHFDDLIARDTVTYLDKSFEPRAFNQPAPKAKPAKRFARRHPSSRKHSGAVVTASKVIYLDKADPKAAK